MIFNFRSSVPAIMIIGLLILASCKKQVEQPAVNFSGFTPGQGIAGDAITLNGDNFSPTASANSVDFNGTFATVVSATATALVATVPQGATSGKITVTVGGKKSTSTDDFIVLQAPTISNFAPDNGAVGTMVTITGTNFDPNPANNQVKFNGTSAAVASATTTTLTIMVPPGSTSGKISVTTNSITVSTATSFNVLSLSITNFAPVIGVAGSLVTLTGTQFDPTTSNNVVKFNGLIATVNLASPDGTSLVVTVPKGATSGAIAITANNVTVASANNFTVPHDSYVSFRVKEIDVTDGSKVEYNYDINNKPTSSNWYYKDASTNTYVLDYTITYNYGVSDELISYVKLNLTSNLAYKYDFAYANGLFQQKLISKAQVVNGVIGAYQAQSSQTFTYQNGLISNCLIKNGIGNVIFQNTYVYSVVNGDMQTSIHYTPSSGQPYDATHVFYNAIINPDPNPDPEESHLLEKSYQVTINQMYNYNNIYALDAQGRLGTLTSTYPNYAAGTYTNTYVYEPKQ